MLWHANTDRISPPLPIEILWRSGDMEWAVSWLSRLSGMKQLPQTTPSEVDLCSNMVPRTGVLSPSMVMGHPVRHIQYVDWGDPEGTPIYHLTILAFGCVWSVPGAWASIEARPSSHSQKTRWEWPLHRCIAVWNLPVLREAVYTKPWH